MLVSSVFIIPPFKKKNKKIITNFLLLPQLNMLLAGFVIFFNANIWGDNEKVTLANH